MDEIVAMFGSSDSNLKFDIDLVKKIAMDYKSPGPSSGTKRTAKRGAGRSAPSGGSKRQKHKDVRSIVADLKKMLKKIRTIEVRPWSGRP